MVFRQSRLEHLASVPFRVIAAGRSGFGKTSGVFSAVTDNYRGCFKKIYIIARTAKLDHSYIQLREWAELHLKQDDQEEPFVFTSMDKDGSMKIFDNNAQLAAKEQIQSKQDISKEPLSSFLRIMNDLSDSAALRQRNESVLNKLKTTGRHSGQSAWVKTVLYQQYPP